MDSILAYFSSVPGLLTDFYHVVVQHWITHAIAVVAGWHILPQPGYMGRLWGRVKAAWAKVFG